MAPNQQQRRSLDASLANLFALNIEHFPFVSAARAFPGDANLNVAAFASIPTIRAPNLPKSDNT